MKNTTDHKKTTNQRTTSIGFCFLDYYEHKPEEAFHFLTGIVCSEICCVFQVDEKYLKKSQGIYAKNTGDSWVNLLDSIMFPELWQQTVTEYCTTEYSKEHFKLVRYAIPEWENRESWRWIDG